MNDVRLIIGKLNRAESVSVFYWQIDEWKTISIGDYAIVENKQDYDLVKIIGIVSTDIKYCRFLTSANNFKKVVKVIKRDKIRND